jgi:hypothetical protein
VPEPEKAAFEKTDAFTLLNLETSPSLGKPMLRSGLALAGAATTLEAFKVGKPVPPEFDGILTAAEIGGLDLMTFKQLWPS